MPLLTELPVASAQLWRVISIDPMDSPETHRCWDSLYWKSCRSIPDPRNNRVRRHRSEPPVESSRVAHCFRVKFELMSDIFGVEMGEKNEKEGEGKE